MSDNVFSFALAAQASQQADATQLHAERAQQEQPTQPARQQDEEELEEMQQQQQAQQPGPAAQRHAEAACASPTAAAAAGLGPSQLSDQTGAAAVPAAGSAPAAADTTDAPAAVAAGAPSVAPSQRSDQTAAAAAAVAQAGGEGEQKGDEATAGPEARAIVPVEQAAPEAEGPDPLSDIDDEDVEMYLAEPEEVGREGTGLACRAWDSRMGGLVWGRQGSAASIRKKEPAWCSAYSPMWLLEPQASSPLCACAGQVQGGDLEHDEPGLAGEAGGQEGCAGERRGCPRVGGEGA